MKPVTFPRRAAAAALAAAVFAAAALPVFASDTSPLPEDSASSQSAAPGSAEPSAPAETTEPSESPAREENAPLAGARKKSSTANWPPTAPFSGSTPSAAWRARPAAPSPTTATTPPSAT